MSEAPKPKVPIREQLATMGRNFWIANLIEAGERLAFFGVRAVLPLYLTGVKAGSLGLSYSEKGVIYMVWAVLQCLLPMVSGGYTDSYGYRKSLAVALALNLCGYALMANATGFGTMMLAGACVGTGTAIFKPPVQGAIARSLGAGNSSLGFGIFYWIVNLGGFFAPMAAAWARGNEQSPTWSHVFYGAALVTAINLLLGMVLFQEPAIDAAAKEKSPVRVFADTMRVLWRDQPMLRLLLLISGFWFMFVQVWDLLPNFIDEWVDARDVGGFLARVLGDGARDFLTATGAAKPEILININSFTVILLVLPASWLFGRYRVMTALLTGIAVATAGFVGAGLTRAGALCALMIFTFSVGEIIYNPKLYEYVGMAAPPDKKAQYMGYLNIPVAIGWAAGNGLSGPVYDRFSSLASLARRELVEKHGMSWEAARQIQPGALLGALAQRMGQQATEGDAVAALWNSYHPWVIWVMLGAVGLASLTGMSLAHWRATRRAAARAED